MTAVKAPDVEAALRRPAPGTRLILLYGPDSGLVAERARRAAEGAVDDPADPFQLVRLDGDQVAGDPARLADEAGTMGLFGGRRAVWVRPTSRNLAPAVETLLAAPFAESLTVVEAGELGPSAPVRSLCERSPLALACPCYADSDRDLGQVVDGMVKAAGLSFGPDARAAVLAALGGDRLATRREVEKLLLYVHGGREVTVADVEAVLSDVSGLALDAVVDAAFGGDRLALDAGYRRVRAEGLHPSVVLGGALRHGLSLLAVRLEVEAGKPARAAVESWRGLHFKRRPGVERQLARWRSAAASRAVADLQAAVFDVRRLPDLADMLALGTLTKLAGFASDREA